MLLQTQENKLLDFFAHHSSSHISDLNGFIYEITLHKARQEYQNQACSVEWIVM